MSKPLTIPVICEECNYIFPYPIAIYDAKHAIITDSGVTCPRCNNLARVPNALYKEIDGIVRVFKIDEGKDVDKLFELLSQIANNPNPNIDDLSSRVNQEIPQYLQIVEVISDLMNRYNINFAAALNWMLTLFMVLYPVYDDMTDKTEEQLDKIYVEQQMQREISRNNLQNDYEKIKEEKKQTELLKELKEELQESNELNKTRNDQEEN